MNGGFIFEGEFSVGEDTKMVEIVLKVSAFEKLVDYTASGIGATAGLLFRPLQAYMEGHANRISARADADALALIAQAQADARQYLVAQDADVHGVVEITRDNIFQRIEFQERKRYANIASVVENAAEELGEKEVPDHEPDHDWTARFFDCVQDVSSEHMQKLWAKVLSGEVENPGRTSLRTLDTLRNMTKRDAELFEGLVGFVIDGEFIFYDASVVERHQVIKFGDFLKLQDCGLISVVPFLEKTFSAKGIKKMMLPYQAEALLITADDGIRAKLTIPQFPLTAAGRQLYGVVQGTVQMAYLHDFANFLHLERCQLALLHGARMSPGGNLEYVSSTPIEPRPIQPGTRLR